MDEGYNFSIIEADFKKYITSGNKVLGKNTVKNYLSDLRFFLGWYNHYKKHQISDQNPATNDRYFDEIDTKTVEDYISYLEITQTSPMTIKRRVSSLSSFLNYCMRSGFIKENYVKSMKQEQKKSLELDSDDDLGPESNPELDTQPQMPSKDLIKKTSNPPNSYEKKRSFNFSAVLYAFLLFTSLAYTIINSHKLAPSQVPYLSSASTNDTRVLTYKGRLTDSLGNPISTKTDVRFRIYRSASSDKSVYESNNCTVYPDVEGNFEVAIGSSARNINTQGCDKKIPANLFSSTSPLYLGITVGTNAEMKPRQEISNVGLADNALRVNGMNIGGNTNNIPYIDKNGQISFTNDSPSLNATSVSEDFKITSSRSLLLQSGGDGNLTFSATESGKIRFLTNGSEIDRMVIAENGNVGIGTLNPSYFRLESSGSIGPSITNTYSLGAPNRMWSNLYVSRICFDEQEKKCTTGFSTAATASTVSPGTADTNASLTSTDLLVGNTATDSANIKLSAQNGNPSFIRTGYLGINTTSPQAALDVMGTASFGGNVVDITTHSNEDLTLQANGTGIIKLNNDTSVGGSFRAGTNVSNGITVLDIAGNPTSFALCHSSSGTDNQQIVACAPSGTADFAEMYPVEQNSDYGEIMSLSPKEVKTTDGDYIRKLVASTNSYDQHLLGVISNNYENFISVGHNLRPEDNPKPIALKGRVPVKISNSSESIEAGDYLTSSGDKGKAMKATRPGVVIGKALEDWSPTSGKNQIMVFVNTTYADPTDSTFALSESLNKFISKIYTTISPEGKILSPVVETDQLIAKDITTDTISPKNKDIHIDLGKQSSGSGELSKLVINGLNEKPVATVDAQGNIDTQGNVSAKDASFSGTLIADSIDSKNIKDLENRLSNAVKKTDYTQDLNSIQSQLGDLKKTSLPNLALYPPAPQGVAGSPAMEGLLDNLTVTGQTNLFNLNVYEKIYTLRDELKISALASINFMDGAIVMTRDGNITAKGTITAKEVKATKFSVNNDAGQETASIDASGSAKFSSLSLDTNLNGSTPSAIIASDRIFDQNGAPLPAIETKKEAAGVGLIPQDQPELVVYNEGLKNASLIFLTPTQSTSTASASLYVAKKETCEGTTVEGAACRPYFTVSAGRGPHPEINFNWLILNGK